MTGGGPKRTLAESIADALVIDEPDEDTLVGALKDVIGIVDGTWGLVVYDEIEEREAEDQVFTYLLGKYAASVVSDNEVSRDAHIKELEQHFDQQAIEAVCNHDSTHYWDDSVQIRPQFYKAVAADLGERYGSRGTGRPTSDDSESQE